jgi:quinohemoprotein amine dehydrogenase
MVYDTVSRIAVTPHAGMARVGGVRVPKQFQQFEARAYHDGPDGEANTDDDLDLGLVDATWGLEEYAATFGDDDLRYVGDIDGQGQFTPALDGPNAERNGNRNNVGDVWVVATYPAGSRTLRARAHLLVTVPNYLRWDPTAVERP